MCADKTPDKIVVSSLCEKLLVGENFIFLLFKFALRVLSGTQVAFDVTQLIYMQLQAFKL